MNLTTQPKYKKRILNKILLMSICGIALNANALTNNINAKAGQNDSPPPKIMVYSYSDNLSNNPISDSTYEPALSQMNEILFGFFTVTNDGHIMGAQNYNNVCNFVATHPNVKVVASIGGWGNSSTFSQAFSSANNRQNFINDAHWLATSTTICSNGMQAFSGIDIDWEYPVNRIDFSGNEASPQDTQNLHQLIIDLRTSLGSNAIISLAIPHGNNDLDGGSIDNYFGESPRGNPDPTTQAFINAVTSFNLMSYDFMAFATKTVTNAPLNSDNQGQSIIDGVSALTSNGVPTNKIILGAPLYGRSISGTGAGRCLQTVPSNLDLGLNIALPPIDKSGSQPPCVTNWPAYNSIDMSVAKYNTYYNYDTAQQTIELGDDSFMSFDSPYNIGNKANYVKSSNLGGMFFWQVTQDTPYNDGRTITLVNGTTYPLSLLKTAHDWLNTPQK